MFLYQELLQTFNKIITDVSKTLDQSFKKPIPPASLKETHAVSTDESRHTLNGINFIAEPERKHRVGKPIGPAPTIKGVAPKYYENFIDTQHGPAPGKKLTPEFNYNNIKNLIDKKPHRGSGVAAGIDRATGLPTTEWLQSQQEKPQGQARASATRDPKQNPALAALMAAPPGSAMVEARPGEPGAIMGSVIVGKDDPRHPDNANLQKPMEGGPPGAGGFGQEWEAGKLRPGAPPGATDVFFLPPDKAKPTPQPKTAPRPVSQLMGQQQANAGANAQANLSWTAQMLHAQQVAAAGGGTMGIQALNMMRPMSFNQTTSGGLANVIPEVGQNRADRIRDLADERAFTNFDSTARTYFPNVAENITKDLSSGITPTLESVTQTPKTVAKIAGLDKEVRAKDAKGRFVADDKSTPDVDESKKMVRKKRTTKKKKPAAKKRASKKTKK